MVSVSCRHGLRTRTYHDDIGHRARLDIDQGPGMRRIVGVLVLRFMLDGWRGTVRRGVLCSPTWPERVPPRMRICYLDTAKSTAGNEDFTA